MKNDLVSVIMPVYNSKAFVSDAIRSVLDQSYQNLELIAVDDASADESLSRIREFQDERLKCISLQENVGAGKARNTAINLARGRYIAFIDSDDIWLENKLSEQIHFMQKQKTSLSYTDYYLMDEKSRFTHLLSAPSQVNFQMMTKNNYIGCLTAMYDTKVLGKMYMPETRKRQDWALWLDILRKTDRAEGLGIPLAAYRKTNRSLSRNKLNLIGENFRFYKESLGYNTFVSGIYFIRFLWTYSCYKITSVKSID